MSPSWDSALVRTMSSSNSSALLCRLLWARRDELRRLPGRTIRRAAGSETKFVALLVPLLITVVPGEPLFQLFYQLVHGSYCGDRVLDAELFATFLAGHDFRIRTLGHFAIA